VYDSFNAAEKFAHGNLELMLKTNHHLRDSLTLLVLKYYLDWRDSLEPFFRENIKGEIRRT